MAGERTTAYPVAQHNRNLLGWFVKVDDSAFQKTRDNSKHLRTQGHGFGANAGRTCVRWRDGVWPRRLMKGAHLLRTAKAIRLLPRWSQRNGMLLALNPCSVVMMPMRPPHSLQTSIQTRVSAIAACTGATEQVVQPSLGEFLFLWCCLSFSHREPALHLPALGTRLPPIATENCP
jgi:hypothetical protein